MSTYSPIKKLYIRNFRNIGDVEIDFTQSPIVTLVGDNEAGKTSVIKAFATCALHANPRDQKDYIRDNTKMFGIAIELEDGTRVTRIKEASGINSYQISKDNINVWSTNKITDGLPEEVRKIMGLIAEPETNEFLHIRTYEDKLLFVVTPNSTNYKVMYNALKVEQITKAIKNGSVEVNTLKSENNSNEISKNALEQQLKSIHTCDIEPLIGIRDRLKSQLGLLYKINKAKTLLDSIDNTEKQLGALLLIDRFNLQPLNEVITSKLLTANRLLNNKNNSEKLVKNLEELNNIEEISTNKLDRLYSIINKKNILNDKVKKASLLNSVNEISEISELNAIQINKIYTLLNRMEAYKAQESLMGIEQYNEINTVILNKVNRAKQIIAENKDKQTALEQINNYICQVHDYMKQCGVAVEACPKCGEAVIFDIDKIEA